MKTSFIPNFIGKRWLKISLRTFHILGVAGVFSTVLTQTPQPVYWALMFITGLGLLALEALSNIIWFVQIRGLVMYLKLGLLAILYFYPDYAWYCLVLMIVLAGMISHAPSSVRYYSFIHRKKVTSLNDVKG